MITSSTWSSRIDGGRPGRGSSCRPSRRRAMNRARQRSTVDSSTPRSAAACLFVPPSAQRSTIFARSARNWAVFARRAHRISWARSASSSTSGALAPPDRRGVLQPGQPLRRELAPPLRHRLDRHPQRLRRPGIRHPLGARQDDPGPVSPPAPRHPRPAHQLSPLILRQHDRHRRRTRMRHDRRLAASKHNPQDFRRGTLVPDGSMAVVGAGQWPREVRHSRPQSMALLYKTAVRRWP